MNTFMVLFLAPATVMDEWMKKAPAEREEGEKKMRAEWDAWTATHVSMIKETKAAGKTKKVDASGVKDTRNDIMLYSIVEGASAESVAETFVGHPHFTIPEASIEIMSIRSM
jgi:hypothetical protein